jgi:hypothetical protein
MIHAASQKRTLRRAAIRNGTAEATQLADRKALRSIVAQHFSSDLPERDNTRGWGAWLAAMQSQ